MATDSNLVPPPPPPIQPSEPSGQFVEYEAFIEAQLRKTRGHVRSVDIAGNLMALAVGTLTFFLLAAVFDHWIVPGGLGFWGRLALLAIYLGAVGYILIAQILPLLIRRINPVYAAHTIERSKPSLKNMLVNFLLFREDPSGINQVVYEAIEEQAATHLAQVRVEAAVDRSKLIRIGYALVAVLVICVLYALFSPKDMFKSVGRVIMPWADINRPTRTSIDEIEPRDTQAFRGQQVTVAARVQGVANGSRVTLFYSTEDGQIVDRPVEMILPPEGYKHTCVLPAGDSSLQQSLSYRITAGDAETRRYRIEVVAAPTIVVRALEYKYPSYTGLLPARVDHQGDIKAIEGTEVTVLAEANQDISTASIDFACDSSPELRMATEGLTARGMFPLVLKDDKPEHTTYQLLFKNSQGQRNPQPVKHQIEVTRDIPPELEFVAPKKDLVDVPQNASLELELVANDPDFALRRVKLLATVGTRSVLDQSLLDESWRGQFVKKFRFEPSKLGLKIGELVEYSAVAEDNKEPVSNRTQTVKRRLRVISPTPNARNQDQLANNDKPSDERPGGQPKADGGNHSDQPRGKQDQRPDDKKEDRANDDPRNPDEGKADNAAQPGQDQNPDEAEDRQGDEGTVGKNKPGNAQNNGKQPDRAPADAQPGDQNQPNEKQPNENQPDDKAKPDDKGGKAKPGEKAQQGGKSKPGENAQPGAQPNEKSKPDGDNKNQQDQGGRPGDKPAGQGAKGGDKQAGKPGEQGKGEPKDEGKGADQADEPVPSDGSDDANAIDKILKHREQKEPQNSPKKQPGKQGQQGGQRDGQEKQDQQRDDQQPDDDQQRNSPDGGANDPNDAGKQPGAKEQGKPSDKNGKQPGAKDPNSKSGSEPGSKQKPDSSQKPDGGQTPDAAKPDGGEQSEAGEKSDRDSDKQDGSAQDKSQPGDDNAQKSNKPDAKNGQQPAGQQKSPDGKKQPGGAKDPGAQKQPGIEKDPHAQKDPSGQQQPNSQQPDSQQKPDGQPDGKQKPEGQQQPEGQAKAGQHGKSQDKNNGQPPSGKKPSAQQQPNQQQPNQQAGKQPSADKQQQDKQQADSQGSPQDKQQGPSGAKQDTQQNKPDKAPPDPLADQKAQEKSQSAHKESSEDKEANAPQSPSTSSKESDTQGQNDGDRSGDGKKGGGQKANKPGTGGAGENTPNDEGSGKSDQPGPGENSSKPGEREGNQKTGKQGSKPGDGSKSAPSEKVGGESNSEQSSGDKASQPTPGAQSGGQQQDHQGTGDPTGGGKGTPGEQEFKYSPDKADEANLDYARKATDLALNHLKNELRKNQPDKELLDKLGWTRQELESFVKRWEQMRQQANIPGDSGAGARRDLDEALRSLGLRPQATKIKGNASRGDTTQNLKESRRTPPPPQFADEYKAYKQSTAKGGEK